MQINAFGLTDVIAVYNRTKRKCWKLFRFKYLNTKYSRTRLLLVLGIRCNDNTIPVAFLRGLDRIDLPLEKKKKITNVQSVGGTGNGVQKRNRRAKWDATQFDIIDREVFRTAFRIFVRTFNEYWYRYSRGSIWLFIEKIPFFSMEQRSDAAPNTT